MAALDKLSIDTPEQVALDFEVATIGSRFLALTIDTLIQLGTTLLVVGLGLGVTWLTRTRWAAAETWVSAVLVIVWFLLMNAYFAFFETVWNGQTPGKRVIGLRVISITGRPLSPYEAILRNVVRIADQLPGTYAVGIVVIFITERSQRLGDLAAATVVVHERAVARSEAEPAAGIAATPTYHGATGLTPEEIAVIDMFFRRREELSNYARSRTAHQIAARVRGRLAVTVRMDDEKFLEEIMSEYRSSGRYR